MSRVGLSKRSEIFLSANPPPRNDPPANTPGSYILVLHSEATRTVRIGARGSLCTLPGYYYYCGSAFGPGGVRARIKRHVRLEKTQRWHIDYLRCLLVVREVWISFDGKNQEHIWAGLLNEMRLSEIPMPGFGSSDCRCPAHLFYFKRALAFGTFRKRARFHGTEHLRNLTCGSL